MDLIVDNIGSIIVGLVILAIMVAIIASLVRKHKRGISINCDCGCEGCAAGSSCCPAPPASPPPSGSA